MSGPHPYMPNLFSGSSGSEIGHSGQYEQCGKGCGRAGAGKALIRKFPSTDRILPDARLRHKPFVQTCLRTGTSPGRGAGSCPEQGPGRLAPARHEPDRICASAPSAPRAIFSRPCFPACNICWLCIFCRLCILTLSIEDLPNRPCSLPKGSGPWGRRPPQAPGMVPPSLVTR